MSACTGISQTIRTVTHNSFIANKGCIFLNARKEKCTFK
jgi:hypothetical protein